MSGSKKTETTLQLKQKVKQDKLNILYRYLNIAGNPDLINLDRFRLNILKKE